MLETKHVPNLMRHSPQWPLQPSLSFLLFCLLAFFVDPIEVWVVSRKGEDSAAVRGRCEAEDIVPFVPRVQILIGHCQHTEHVFDLICLQRFQYLSSMQLLYILVQSWWDVVRGDKVSGKRVLDCFLALSVLLVKAVTWVDELDLDSSEVCLTVYQQLVLSLYCDRVVDQEQIDDFLHSWHPCNVGTSRRKLFDCLPSFLLGHQPVIVFSHHLRLV